MNKTPGLLHVCKFSGGVIHGRLIFGGGDLCMGQIFSS